MLGERIRLALGHKIRERRTYLGFTQSEVAQSIGIPRPSLTLIESGKRPVSAEELQKLAVLLKTSVDWLMDTYPRENIVLPEKFKELDSKDIAELELFAEFLLRRKHV